MKSVKTQSDSEQNRQAKEIEALRTRAANMVTAQRRTIMVRIHSLLDDGARTVTDTEDVLSTALRRIDSAVLRGAVEAVTDEQFYAFVHGVIERTIKEKLKRSIRLRARERVANEVHLTLRSSTAQSRTLAKEDLQRIGAAISDPIDREIVLHKGRGLSWGQIADLVSMDPAAVRKRWSRMRVRVRLMVERDDHHAESE